MSSIYRLTGFLLSLCCLLQQPAFGQSQPSSASLSPVDSFRKYRQAGDTTMEIVIPGFADRLALMRVGQLQLGIHVHTDSDSHYTIYRKYGQQWRRMDTAVSVANPIQWHSTDLNGDGFKDLCIGSSTTGGNYNTLVYLYYPGRDMLVRNKSFEVTNAAYDPQLRRVRSSWSSPNTGNSRSIYRISGDSLVLEKEAIFSPQGSAADTCGLEEYTYRKGRKVVLHSWYGSCDRLFRRFEQLFWKGPNDYFDTLGVE